MPLAKTAAEVSFYKQLELANIEENNRIKRNLEYTEPSDRESSKNDQRSKSDIPKRILFEYTHRLEDICKNLEISSNKIEYDSLIDNIIIEGKEGYIRADDKYFYVCVFSNSKRQLSSIKKKLSFMQLTRDRSDVVFRIELP